MYSEGNMHKQKLKYHLSSSQAWPDAIANYPPCIAYFVILPLSGVGSSFCKPFKTASTSLKINFNPTATIND